MEILIKKGKTLSIYDGELFHKKNNIFIVIAARLLEINIISQHTNISLMQSVVSRLLY